MYVRQLRVGARVSVRVWGNPNKYQTRGTITEVEKIGNHYRLTITDSSGDSSKHWIHRVKYVGSPMFKDPYRLYVHKFFCRRSRHNVKKGVPPVMLTPHVDYTPMLFERSDIQAIVDLLAGNPNIEWTRKEFFEILMKIKNIYIGI